ncbi:MAG: hypothetical protein Q4C77_07740 [Eubacteriales bacterium]|nr:hypothetical protein [Eubacteriales bacterium]
MNTKNTLDILQEDIIIPEIVQEKANDAFARIHLEASGNTESKQNSKTGNFQSRRTSSGASGAKVTAISGRRKHRKKIIATAFAAALAVCTVTAGAAVYMNWSSGLEKELRVTEEQKQAAETSGLADFPKMSVTNAGVTVTAQQSIVDNYYAYLSFKVEGYSVEPGIQPDFGSMNVLVDGQSVTLGASFYDGLIFGDNGKAVLADGSPIPLNEDGSLLLDYTQEDGSLEYRINLSANGEKGAFFGKPIHVEFKDLGYYTGKAEDIQTEVEGTWTFDWTLQGDDSIYTAECSEPLGDTGATIIGAEISPISIKAIYDFPREEVTETGYNEYEEVVDGETRQVSEPFEYTHYTEPPVLRGVKLKDGTLLSNLYMGPGQMGYVDAESTQYVSMFAIDRILDVDEVQSLVFIKSIPEDAGDGEYTLTEDDFYIVDIR